MVDEYDSETENINNNNDGIYNRSSFEERFPRPNAARVMQSPNRLPISLMTRPGLRPPFNQRFDNNNTMRLPNYGPDFNKTGGRLDNNYLSMPPKAQFNRPNVPNRLGMRIPNRDFQDRHLFERLPFQNRFPQPQNCQQYQMQPRMPVENNRVESQKFHGSTEEIIHEENKFVSGEEEEDAINETNKKIDQTAVAKNSDKLEVTEMPNIISGGNFDDKTDIAKDRTETLNSPLVFEKWNANTFNKANVDRFNAPFPRQRGPGLLEKPTNFGAFERKNVNQTFERPNSFSFRQPNFTSVTERSNQLQSSVVSDQLQPFVGIIPSQHSTVFSQSQSISGSNKPQFSAESNLLQSSGNFNPLQSSVGSNQSQSFVRPNQLQPSFRFGQLKSADGINQLQSPIRFNQSKPTDGFNQSFSFKKASQSPSSEVFNTSKSFDRPNQLQSFDQMNAPPSFDLSNAPPSFDRSNAPPPFDRLNAPPPFDRLNAPPSFDRSNVPSSSDKSNAVPSFDRATATLSFDQFNAPPPFDCANVRPFNPPNAPPSFDRFITPPQFDVNNAPPMFNRPNVPKITDSSTSFDQVNSSRIYRPPNQESLNTPRIQHPPVFERPNVPRMEPPRLAHPFVPKVEPPKFDRPPAPRLEPPAITERPNLPLIQPPPPRYPVVGLPPMNFPGMPPMQSQPPQPLLPVSSTPSHPVMTTAVTIPTIPFQGVSTMPPIFDPHMRFITRPPERTPMVHVERPMMPAFQMPPAFRPPFIHMPPPNIFQAPPLPIQTDPNLIQNKQENPLTMATLNDEEVWVQNPTSDGRFYFYNWKTRLTNWERPQGVRIVTQTELNNVLSNKTQPIISSGPMQAVTTTISVSAEKPAELADWNEYRSPEGRPYYHNRRTSVTTWEKPQVMVDWEKRSQGSRTTVDGTQLSGDNVSITKSNDKSDKMAVDQDESSDESNSDDDEDGGGGDEDDENDGGKTRDKSKPISSTPVHGSPWCIVWTGDGRVFFFNPAKRTSVWERPEELIGRTDVDKILDKPPKELLEKKRSEPPAKKQKIENKIEKKIEKSTAGVGKKSSGNSKMEFGSTEIASLSKEAAKEAEEKAAKERALLPLEVRMTQFREMLIEKQVSAFSTWEKELHKIVFDQRYLLLTSRERKLAFEDFVRDRAIEERRDKKTPGKEKKEQYRKLLKEADVTTKSTFTDFANKYSNDDRFKAIDKLRDREILFSDYVDELSSNKDKEDNDKTKEAYMSLLEENKFAFDTHWIEARKKIDNDVRYKAVDTSMQREEWFKEYVRKTSSRDDSDSTQDREKQGSNNSNNAKDRDKQREMVETFKILLRDMVKNCDDSWKQVKRILRKDARWEDISGKIERGVRDSIFKDHMCSLRNKKK